MTLSVCFNNACMYIIYVNYKSKDMLHVKQKKNLEWIYLKVSLKIKFSSVIRLKSTGLYQFNSKIFTAHFIIKFIIFFEIIYLNLKIKI